VRKGRPGLARQQVQRRRSFVKLIKWRTGCEARIACMKRDYGWSRSLMDGVDGTRTWCGWGVLVHNSVKIGGLLDAKDNPASPPPTPLPRPRSGAAKAPPRTDPPRRLPLSA
jgi:IS5 family transposase